MKSSKVLAAIMAASIFVPVIAEAKARGGISVRSSPSVSRPSITTTPRSSVPYSTQKFQGFQTYRSRPQSSYFADRPHMNYYTPTNNNTWFWLYMMQPRGHTTYSNPYNLTPEEKEKLDKERRELKEWTR